MTAIQNSSLAVIWNRGYRIKQSYLKANDIVIHFYRKIPEKTAIRQEIVKKIKPFVFNKNSEKRIRFVLCILQILLVFFCFVKAKNIL
jgi:hypothetical protein